MRVCAPDYEFSLSSHVTAATPCCSASCSSGVIMRAERTPFLVWQRPGRRWCAAAAWLCPRRSPAGNISSSGFYPAYNTIKDSSLKSHIRCAVRHTRRPHDVTVHSLNSSYTGGSRQREAGKSIHAAKRQQRCCRYDHCACKFACMCVRACVHCRVCGVTRSATVSPERHGSGNPGHGVERGLRTDAFCAGPAPHHPDTAHGCIALRVRAKEPRRKARRLHGPRGISLCDGGRGNFGGKKT